METKSRSWVRAGQAILLVVALLAGFLSAAATSSEADAQIRTDMVEITKVEGSTVVLEWPADVFADGYEVWVNGEWWGYTATPSYRSNNFDRDIDNDIEIKAFVWGAPEDGLAFGFIPAVNPAPMCNGLVPTLRGGAGPDVLTGTPGDDIIWGGAGNDVIRGLGGNDIICGGRGADELRGGNGDDLIFGAGEGDVVIGGPGNDQLFGGPGNDLIFGNRGLDEMFGGGGYDEAIGSGDDICWTIQRSRGCTLR